MYYHNQRPHGSTANDSTCRFGKNNTWE